MWNNESQRVILSLQQRPFPYSQLLLEQYVLRLSQTRIGSNFCIQKITKKINFQKQMKNIINSRTDDREYSSKGDLPETFFFLNLDCTSRVNRCRTCLWLKILTNNDQNQKFKKKQKRISKMHMI